MPDTTPQAMTEPVKCWCGATPILDEDSPEGEARDFYYQCHNCEENTASFATREEAVTAWNELIAFIHDAVKALPPAYVAGPESIEQIRKTAKNKTARILLAVTDARDATIAAKDAEIARLEQENGELWAAADERADNPDAERDALKAEVATKADRIEALERALRSARIYVVNDYAEYDSPSAKDDLREIDAALSGAPAPPLEELMLRRPKGSNADEWAMFLEHWGDARSYIAVQIAEAIDAAAGTPAPDALVDIAAERRRQIEVEGWSAEHDTHHVPGELALAAACYAVTDYPHANAENAVQTLWPWERKWWKPKDKRLNLVRAGALILAEIERFDRALSAHRGESGNG